MRYQSHFRAVCAKDLWKAEMLDLVTACIRLWYFFFNFYIGSYYTVNNLGTHCHRAPSNSCVSRTFLTIPPSYDSQSSPCLTPTVPSPSSCHLSWYTLRTEGGSIQRGFAAVWGSVLFLSLWYTVSTHDIKYNQKQNRLQVAEETHSERLEEHRLQEEGGAFRSIQ